MCRQMHVVARERKNEPGTNRFAGKSPRDALGEGSAGANARDG
jgi:hypothetical protein